MGHEHEDLVLARGQLDARQAPPRSLLPALAPGPPGNGWPPPPIADQGYREVFADDFYTFNRAVWDDHIWYDQPPSPTWTNLQYAQNGTLHLATSRDYSCGSGCNYPMNTVTTQTSGKTFRYG